MARASSTFMVFVLALGSVAACGGSAGVDYFFGGGSTGGGSGSGGGGGDGIGSALGSSGSTASSAGAAAGSPASSGEASVDADGGASAAGAVGVDIANAGAGLGGSGTGTPADPPCSPVTDGKHGATGALGTTGPFCLRVSDDITGWGCSNFEGRTVKVNGTLLKCGVLPLPDKLHGDYYFDVSAGDYDYASMFWF